MPPNPLIPDLDWESLDRPELMRHLGYAIRATQNASETYDEAVAAHLGINSTDLRCIDIIDRAGTISAGELATACGLTTAAITTVLDRLERGGFAARVRDPEDRRRVLVALDPEGGKRVTDLYEPLKETAAEAFSTLSDDDMRNVIEFLTTGIRVNTELAERLRARTAADRSR